jgi:Ino eighty subunit 1
VARSHLNTGYNLEWADLFTPVPYSSASRAQAFLWLCYHYLESTTGNPYADEFASNNPGSAPQLVPLTPEATAAENVDSSEELAWGVQMAEKRLEFLTKVKAEKEQDEREKAKVKEQERERLVSGLTGGHPKSSARRASSAHPHPGSSSRPRRNKHASSSRPERDGECSFRLMSLSADGGTAALSPSAFPLRNYELDGRPMSPYSRSQSGTHNPRRNTTRRTVSDSYHLPPAGWPRRTLVDNAFQLALTTDPLADSGEEDEDARCDYSELCDDASLQIRIPRYFFPC